MNDFEPQAVVDTLIAESRQSMHWSMTASAVPAYLRAVPSTTTESITLPAPVTSGPALHKVLQSRMAVKQYAPASVSLGVVGTMLAAACRGDETEWSAARDAGVHLQFLVLGWQVEELQARGPTLLCYEPTTHSLRVVGPAPSPQEATDTLLLQRDFASAPFVIFIAGSLAAAISWQGSAGHRHLLVRAGGAANHLLLAGAALGLMGCPFGGVVSTVVHRLYGLDGYRLRHLFAVAAGYPPAQG